MDIDFAFLADSAEAVNGKLYVMGGSIDTIFSPGVPVIHPKLSFAMRLLASAGEVGRKHNLEITVIDEDGKRIAAAAGAIEIGKNPNVPRGWKHGFLAVLNFANLKFDKFGTYSFEVIVNNSSLKSVLLQIGQVAQIQSS